MIFCSNCGQQLNDDAKFCHSCGTKTETTNNSYTKRETVFEGNIHKCPSCGEFINSFTAICPTCGYEFRGTNVSSSMQTFSYEVAKTNTIEIKASIIRNFPIPNTKEDIMEFILLASTNLIGEQDATVFDAWFVKFNQCYQKAKYVINDPASFANIQDIYDNTIKQLKREKRKRNLKAFSKTISKSSGAASNGFIIIGAIIGIILYIAAVIIESKKGNGSIFQLVGAIILIVSTATLFKKSSTLIDFVFGIASGALSLYLARFLENGSMLQLSGFIIIILVVIAYFVKIFKK